MEALPSGKFHTTTNPHPPAPASVLAGRHGRASRRPGPGISALLLGLALASTLDWTLQAQAVPQYAGRPFVLVARNKVTDPAAGFQITDFARAQVVGDAVVFVPLMPDFKPGGVFSSRGGYLTRIAGLGTSTPAGTLQSFHRGFARDTSGGTDFVFAAGPAQPDALLWTDGANFTVRLAPGTVLPNSGGKAANFLGEPFLAGNAPAVIAGNQTTAGADTFRGVYRVEAGALVPVADTATALPGLGVPDTFSSQVGFDGQAVAFWAAKGPTGASQGMFVQPAAGQALVLIARDGDAFPDGGTIKGFYSPPFVAEGAVYFFAYDAANVARLLKYAGGALTVLTKDGALTAENDALQGLGQFGLVVEGGKVFFPANTARGPGLYVLDGPALQTVISPGFSGGLAGISPAAYVLQDVAGDTIVLMAADTAGNRRLLANLARPAIPVIVSAPTNLTVAGGARVELQVNALGDAPLAFEWRVNSPTGVVIRATTDRLVIESAGALDSGYYDLVVTNAFGIASSSFLLNVEVPPLIVSGPDSVTVEAGESLRLQVGAVGGLPLAYSWEKDGAPLSDVSSTSWQFARAAAAATDAGRYRVTVSNAWGQVTSAEAVVIVTPAPPNPVVAGKRLVPVLDGSVPPPGLDVPLVVSSANARLWGTRFVFAAQNALRQWLGVFVWDAGQWSRLLAPDAELPHGLGPAQGFSLVRTDAAESLVLLGLKAGIPVGIYRWNGAALEAIADTTTAIPEGGGATFANFLGEVVHTAGRTLFAINLSGKPALFLHDGTMLRRLIAPAQELPVVGSATANLTSLALDAGGEYLTSAATLRYEQEVLLRGQMNGGVTALLTKGDIIPDTESMVLRFRAAAANEGKFFTVVQSVAGAQHVLELQPDRPRRIANPGMDVVGEGILQGIEHLSLRAFGGRAWFTGRLTTPDGTVRHGLLAANASGLEPVFFATKLDARRISRMDLVGVDSERILVSVFLEAGGQAFYANVGPVNDEPLVLQYARPAAGTLHLSVPAGTTLEASDQLGTTWRPVAGTGAVEVTVGLGARFFRLRRP